MQRVIGLIVLLPVGLTGTGSPGATVSQADLAIGLFTSPATGIVGAPFTVAASVANLGPDAAVSAADRFLTSYTGKEAPGQVHLSAVAAAGLSQVTHLISVGFESEAEAETWEDSIATTKDFASYQKASDKVSTFAGAFMIRTIQTWGSSGD